VTAAWDFVCASALAVFAYHATFARFWQGIASVGFGPDALQLGARGVAMGILLHVIVAFTWSALFVLDCVVSARTRRIVARPAGALAFAAAYGPFIWLCMSLIVIPQATGRPPSFGFRWWLQVFAHIPFVTLPMVFTARRLLGLSGSRDLQPVVIEAAAPATSPLT
jgi:hypothetical protein